MAEQRRHMEHFGPDLSRGPFTSNSPTVAAVQIASLLAQLRVPLLRSDTEIQAHADFIRGLADRLMPDAAQAIYLTVGIEAANEIYTTIREDSSERSLLHCWLADAPGGGETSVLPDEVSFVGGVVLQTVTNLKRYLVIGPDSGAVTARVKSTLDQTWYWAVERNGRVYYSAALNFNI
ncbi:MAG: hypothetical protein ACKVS9_03135 [Phycisphaerae bacterium]